MRLEFRVTAADPGCQCSAWRVNVLLLWCTDRTSLMILTTNTCVLEISLYNCCCFGVIWGPRGDSSWKKKRVWKKGQYLRDLTIGLFRNIYRFSIIFFLFKPHVPSVALQVLAISFTFWLCQPEAHGMLFWVDIDTQNKAQFYSEKKNRKTKHAASLQVFD